MNLYVKSAAGAVVALAAAAAGCSGPEEVKAQYDKDLRNLEQQVSELKKRNEDLEARYGGVTPVKFDDWVKQLEARLSDELKKALAEFENTPGVTSLGNGGFRFEEGVLFASGQATVKTEGQAVLKKFVTIFKDQDVRFQIDGHTDNEPIRVKIKEYGRALNAELAFFRAWGVGEILAKNGIAKDRLSWKSYGENAPIVANDTKANKAKNRRVEIWVQPSK